MKTMIERVAISQSEFDGRPWMSMPKGERNRYMDRARAAIEAMREPTDSMLEKFDDLYWAGVTWEAMIDAALKDQQ